MADPSIALVYYVNLFIISLIALLVLICSRRAIARFHSFSELTSGIFLRNVSTFPRPRGLQRNVSINTVGASTIADTNDDIYSLYSPDTITAPTRRQTIQTSYPPHVSPCPTFFQPLLLPLRKRVDSNYSLAQLFVQLIWFSVLIFEAFYQSTGPLLDSQRTAWIGVSQLPFVFAFSAKNNVLGMLLGMGYEKLNFMHRFVARLTIITLNLHAIHYVYVWILAGTFQAKVALPRYYWAIIALVCIDCLFFFSTAWWRKKAYHVFLTTHILSYIVLFPALYFHYKATLPYIIACLSIMAFDHMFRSFKTRITTATLRSIPELGATRIECRDINAGWRAGQHVRVRVLSSGIGWFGWMGIHPFTISSLSARKGGTEGEGLVLMCKKTPNPAGWTNKLYEFAKLGSYGNSEKGADSGRTVRVAIEGPYGGPGNTMFASYSAAVLVCGGSGITFGLSVLEDLIEKDMLRKSRVKVIELVWIVQDPASLVPLLPVLTSLIRQSSSSNDASYATLKVSVFYTRAPIGKFPFEEGFNFKYPRLTLSPGRPKTGRILEGVMGKIVRLGAGVKDDERNTGVIVGVCGPVEMADEVSAEVGKLDEGRREKVGGVDLVEEVFGW
ncbi:hypothetical protein C8J56DRAFT_1019736 [Mycena floridula]|nr:hypothetical protein C8J56DRAFT_1019736 [Mycena floridula]